jgi:hypothetical protein
MTYLDSAENVTISKARAIQEVLKHGANEIDFLNDCGNFEFYNAQSVLFWLGY